MQNNPKLRIAAEVIKLIHDKLKDKIITTLLKEIQADIIVIFESKNHKKTYFKIFKNLKLLTRI